jgi:membrane fusion protein (multidrug efflux system)
VELPTEDNIIALPETALTTSLYGDFIYVVVPADKDGKATTGKIDAADKDQNLIAHQVFVKLGRSSEGRVEIREGVKPGDTVVNAGQNRLTNGAAVTIDNTVQPSQAKTNAAGGYGSQ